MLLIIVYAAIIITVFGIIIHQLTGDDVFVQDLRAAFIRFGAGVTLSLFPVTWWSFRPHYQLEVNELLENFIICLRLACCASAFVLIPLSTLQIIGFFIKWVLSRKPQI